MDKSKELKATLKLVNNKLHFMGSVEGHDPVSIDYISPIGDDLGYTSLELLLLSFSSCLGSAVLSLLRKMNKTITALDIASTGIRNTEHPTGFRVIRLQIDLRSPDVTVPEVQKVIAMAEEKYCPVWAMIRGNTTVETAVAIRQ